MPDDAEFVLGTLVNNSDTDNDGIPDGTEIQNGTDPLDGQPARTGIIATADTPGTAVDVCVFDAGVVAVADGAAGVAIFNVFNGMNPTLVAQIDTPGNAQAVACTDNRVVVADGSGGLSIIDMGDPANAVLERRVALNNAQAVAAFNNRAYIGSGSDVVLIDLNTGSVVSRVSLANTVQDLAFSGDYLYALTIAQLATLPLYEDTLQVLSTVSSPGSAGAGGRRWRLQAGAGILYATHTRGYNTFALSNPAQPQLLAAGSTNQFGWKQLLANGTGLGVAAVSPNSTDDGPHEISLYDLSDPTQTDRFLTQFETPGLAAALALGNGLAYVADSGAGLQLLNYVAYDSRGISPTITLTANFAQAVAEENKTMRLTALISDDVQLRNVEFYVDGVQVATDGNYPFEHRFTTPLRSIQASFTVRAKAIDTGGNFAWSTEQIYTLVTDATPPRVTAVAPPQGSFAAPGAITVITATFNEALDPATLLDGGFQLFHAGADNLPETGDDQAVAGVVSFDAPSRTARFTPTSALGEGRYRAHLAATVTDNGGNPLQGGAYSWQFSVGLISWDGGGDGVSWHDARNWERDQVPVAGASVVIPDANGPTVVHSGGETILTTLYSSRPIRLGGGRMIFNGDVTLDRLLLGSELTANGTLTMTGVLTWTGGTLSGNGVIRNRGVILLMSNGARAINAIRLDNRNVIDWQEGGNLTSTNGGKIENHGVVRALGSLITRQLDISVNGPGRIEVLAGILNLGGGSEVTTGGVFSVTTGAILQLTGSGVHTYTGSYRGSGGGSIRIGSGKVAVGAPGATFNFAGDIFQWMGGEIVGPGVLTNRGRIILAGNGARTLNGVRLNNQGVIDWQEGGNLIGVDGGWIENSETVRTSINPVTRQLDVSVNGSGKVEVLSGILNLGGGGSVTTGGNFMVATDAILQLTGSGVHTYTGSYTGSGGGSIRIGSGKVAIGAAGATFNFGGDLFQWTGGEILGPGVLTNSNRIVLTGNGARSLNATLNNQGVIDWQGGGNFIGTDGGRIENAGVVRTSGSPVTRQLDVSVNGSGKVEVLAGVLNLGGGGEVTTGGIFMVATDATLQLTGSGVHTYTGNYVGSGDGTIAIGSGKVAVGAAGAHFDFANDLFQWIGGEILGPGVLTNQNRFVLTGNSSRILNGVEVNNLGVIDWQGGGNLLGTSGGRINNQGLFRTSVSAVTRQIDVAFSGGKVEVLAGTLNLGGEGVTTSGIFTVATNAVLNLTGSGVHTYTGNYVGSGGGIISIGSGKLAIGAAGATFNFGGDLFEWSGGEILGPGVLTNNGRINLRGNLSRTLTGVRLNNRGVIDWPDGGNLYASSGAILNNLATGVIELRGAGSNTLSYGGVGALPSLNNQGIVRAAIGNNNSTIAIPFSGGRVEVLAGTLNLGGEGVTTSGVFTVATGAVLNLTASGVHTYTGNYSGSGGGIIAIGSGKLAIGAAGATFNFGGDLFEWSGGEILGPGVLTNNGRINLRGYQARTLNGVRLNNRGVIDWQEGGNVYINNGAILNNLATGSIELRGSGSGTLSYDGIGARPSLSNLGIIRTSAANGNTTIGIPLTNRGVITAAYGTLTLSGGYTQTAGTTTLNGGTLAGAEAFNIQGGVLSGAGQINAGVINGGSVIPGGMGAIGVLYIQGPYTQTTTGQLVTELSGLDTTQYDQLLVSGPATLNGSLQIHLRNGFTPAVGNNFTVLTYQSHRGAFGTVNGNGQSYAPTYNATTLTITKE